MFFGSLEKVLQEFLPWKSMFRFHKGLSYTFLDSVFHNIKFSYLVLEKGLKYKISSEIAELFFTN